MAMFGCKSWKSKKKKEFDLLIDDIQIMRFKPWRRIEVQASQNFGKILIL